MKVKSIMKKTPFCCRKTDTVQHAAELMKLHDVGSIPVVNNTDERTLIGIVTDRDICLRVIGEGRARPVVRVGDVMTHAPATCHPDDSVSACAAIMERQQVRRVPVVDDRGGCVGIVSQADIVLNDSSEQIAHTVAAISKPHPESRKRMERIAVAAGTT
jgi:CBS domain-containing protein